MNPSTVIGMLGGAALVVGTISLSSVSAGSFWSVSSVLIVLGGTLAATFVSYPLREVMRVMRVFGIVLRNERLYAQDDIDELVQVSKEWFKFDLSGVEHKVRSIRNPFLRTGVQLVIDGTPMDKVMDLLRWRISRLQARERAEAALFRTMAQFAPAFGMLGTLVGLINMLSGLATASVGDIGRNMALALITTFYGLILANMVFKPIAVKLERRTERRVMLMNMVLEGIAMLSERRSPGFVRETLNSFLTHYEDELRQDPHGAPVLADDPAGL